MMSAEHLVLSLGCAMTVAGDLVLLAADWYVHSTGLEKTDIIHQVLSMDISVYDSYYIVAVNYHLCGFHYLLLVQ